MGVPGRVNEAALRLFSVVAFDAACTTRDESTKDLVKTEDSLFTEYQVFIKPEAFYATAQIDAHVRRTMRTAQELNATFYRRWIDIISKTEVQLFIDQIAHYMSTYGTQHTGPAYVPAQAVNLDLPDEEWKITVFGTLEQDELKEKCWSLISEGTALSRETILDCIAILDWSKAKIDISKVRNKEARTLLIARHLEDGTINCTPEEFLRATIYRATDELPVIKSAQLLSSIKLSQRNEVAHAFTGYGINKLASIFNRYKPFFIAFKLANPKNVSVINQISKRSKREHKPLPANPLNSVSHRLLAKSEYHWLESATLAAQLRALNACHLAMHEQHGFKYSIRNGKSWIADGTRSPEARKIAKENFETILSYLKRTVGTRFRGKKILMPGWIKYGLPTSEKQFIGNVPFGTQFQLPSIKNVAIGIFWDKSCRCTDLDLSGVTTEGKHVSWNTSYNEGAFVYSGDMTSLTEHGASEYILCKGTDNAESTAIQLRVNCYSGNTSDHEYDIVIGEGDDITTDYMMNPANRMVNLRYKSQSSMSTMGFLLREGPHTTFVLSPGETGQTRVATSAKAELTQLASNAIQHTLKHSITLNRLLSEFGAEIWTEQPTNEEIDFDFDLSLENINRDFFNLLKEDWTAVEKLEISL